MGAFFYVCGRFPAGIGWFGEKQAGFFYLQIIDINEIMCYNPNKKFKERGMPLSSVR